MIEIPFIPTEPNQFFTVPLNGDEFKLQFRYNPRANVGDKFGAWYMDIYSTSEEPLLAGLKLVPDTILGLNNYQDSDLPNGLFYVYDTGGNSEPPDRNELGYQRRVRIYFFTSEDL